jgi:hypothetical protein
MLYVEPPEGVMRQVIFICCSSVAALIGCRKSDRAAADTAAAGAAAAAGAPATVAEGGKTVPSLSLSDVAGKWTVRAMNEAGDSTLVTYVLNATPNPSGWTIKFPNRPPIAVHVAVSGDSIITDAGPYPSVLRKGVQVTTHGVSRLRGGKLVGTTVAHYTTSGPDSVRRVRTEGTRAP